MPFIERIMLVLRCIKNCGLVPTASSRARLGKTASGSRSFRCNAALALIVLWSIATGTAGAETTVRDHDIDIEDYFSLTVLGDCTISPDGKFIAYTDQRWEPPSDKRNTDLWVVEVETRKSRRLTFDKATDGAPQWSTDSKHIYFTSDMQRGEETDPPYNGKKQVWRSARDGGEPFAVTRVDGGIDLFVLSRDGLTLMYTDTKKVVDDEWKELREKHDQLKYGHGVHEHSRLWKLDLQSWRSEKLVDEKRHVDQIALSPDGRRVAMLSATNDELLSKEGWSQVDVYDLSSKKLSLITPEGWRNAHPSPYGWVDHVEWSGDSAALAFTISFDGYPPQLYVAEFEGDAADLRELQRPDMVTIQGGTTKWRGDSRDLCFLGEQRAVSRVWCINSVRDNQQGPAKPRTDEDSVVGSYSFSTDGNKLAVIFGTTAHTPDVHLLDGGGVLRLTNANPQVDTWKLPQIQRVTWKGARGDEVEGILEVPHDYQFDRRLPMVVELHGGPTSATLLNLRYWIYGRTLLPARGYAVLSPNYRGSTGYGDKFMTDLVGAENQIEVEDILTGVDALVERGIADPERLGVMGWSNGGYLTNCLITQSTRFKAASSGAGVLDMVIQWGTEDTPGHVINFMQSLPWKNPASYEKASPLYRLDKVTTPTLIHVGGNDARVPPAHSQALYRALKHYVNVPTELIVYPDEGHGLTTMKNRRAKLEWDVAWFDRYLLNKSQELPAKPTTN